MEKVYVREVRGRSEKNAFIAFPDKLYKGNKYRATPLHWFEREILNEKKNPAFEYCDFKMWLAYRENQIVGRIAAFNNRRHNELFGEKTARFGWIDFVEDFGVAEVLLSTAEQWAKQQGMTAIHGPLGFTDMDMEGMLVEGFDEYGTQATLYNHAYYPKYLEALGYEKDCDWVQKEIAVPDAVPEKLERFSKLVQQKYDLRILKTRKSKELIPYGRSMFKTLNEAFKGLYGFVPLNDQQIDYYIKQYFSLIKPEFVCFVINPADEVVGFGISMPSLTQALIKAKGKLLPLGFVALLKAINGKNDVIDMYLNGVRPDYQSKGVHSIYYAELTKKYIEHGIKLAVTNPQMEDNAKALQLWKHFEHRTHIVRRCYIKRSI